MVMTDPIADLLTRIRNAIRAGHEKTDVPHSGLKQTIVQILKDEGFVANYRVIEEQPAKLIRVYLRYDAAKGSAVRGLERVSKPGRRFYTPKGDVPRVMGGLGVAIISTSQGLLTDRECRKRGIGGEVLFKAW